MDIDEALNNLGSFLNSPYSFSFMMSEKNKEAIKVIFDYAKNKREHGLKEEWKKWESSIEW